MNEWLIENLVCPINKNPLEYRGDKLISTQGIVYPLVEDIPVMLVRDVDQTIELASASILRSQNEIDSTDRRYPELYLESLGISDREKQELTELASGDQNKIDPVVAYLVGATSGYSYKHLIGKLNKYPIPDIPLENGDNQKLLDIGCSWGRWSISAAGKGYMTVGIDPSLGAVMAAKRVAKSMNLNSLYVVADARFLPFRDSSFNKVFSYSVLQHLSKENVLKVLEQISAVLTDDGRSLIQMPNYYGIRSIQNLARRKFRKARDFEVRYWSPGELLKEFSRIIGKSEIFPDCYFGLGLQKSDIHLMPSKIKLVIKTSELLKNISRKINFISYFADSLFVESINQKV